MEFNPDKLTTEQLEVMWELYKIECEQTHTTPRFSDFAIWLEERQ